VVATNYFYSLRMLPLTEFSRRYDALFRSEKNNLPRVAYITLSQIMCNFPFYGSSIDHNGLLALCSMVINPIYYVHQVGEEAHKYHAAARKYLILVDPHLDPAVLQSSLRAHLSDSTPPSALQETRTQFKNFYYPLQDDIELGLETARLVEKCLGINSQGFTVTRDNWNRMVFNGTDFARVAKYDWNPRLNDLSANLRQFHSLRGSRQKEIKWQIRANITQKLNNN
jgi:hypothetical protein